MLKITILDSIHDDYEVEKKIFASLDHTLQIVSSNDPEAMLKICHDTDGICLNLQTLDKFFIEKLDNCKVISRYGVGVDNVDFEAAKKKDIILCNCPDYCSEEVSDQAMAHLLNLIRQINTRQQNMTKGLWGRQEISAITSIYDKTVGIVGLGKSGRAFLRKIKAFNPEKILIFDPSKNAIDVSHLGGEKVGFKELICSSDILSLHIPLTQKTTHLFSTNEFKLMKPTALIINISRGKIIDEKALTNALITNNIGGAGLDVFEIEPLPHNSPLFKLGNVSLSDHSAWYSPLAVQKVKAICAENVYRVLIGKTTQNQVN